MLTMNYQQKQKAAYPSQRPLNNRSAMAVYSNILDAVYPIVIFHK